MHITKDRIFTCSAIALSFTIGGITVYGGLHLKNQLNKAVKYDTLQTRVSYHEQAEHINAYYFTLGDRTNVAVIRETLQAVDTILPKYFPDGPYQRKDLIALAMAESSFDQYLVGSHKEFGIFQLLPESCRWAGIRKNQFDIRVNTEMALFVLHQKYEERKEYKKAIIAYNGYVIKKGKVSDIYWKRFLKFRRVLDDILPDTTTN